MTPEHTDLALIAVNEQESLDSRTRAIIDHNARVRAGIRARAEAIRSTLLRSTLLIPKTATADAMTDQQVLAADNEFLRIQHDEHRAEAATALAVEQDAHRATRAMLESSRAECDAKTAALRNTNPERVARELERAVAAARDQERASVAVWIKHMLVKLATRLGATAKIESNP